MEPILFALAGLFWILLFNYAPYKFRSTGLVSQWDEEGQEKEQKSLWEGWGRKIIQGIIVPVFLSLTLIFRASCSKNALVFPGDYFPYFALFLTYPYCL